MTQSRCWTLVAVLSLALVVSGSRAGVPVSSKGKTSSSKQKTTTGTLVSKTYPVDDLVRAMGQNYSQNVESLVETIVKTVDPKSWKGKGGSGTIMFHGDSRTLVIRQTSTVHKQVGCVLNALASVHQPQKPSPREITLLSGLTPAGSLPSDSAPKSSPAGAAKQYGHFVMDDVKVNAMGVTCTVKSIRFMYRGDGIDNDVAKCALTGGESEVKKNELPKSVTDLLEKLNQKDKQSCCASGACECCTKAGCCATKCCATASKCCTKTAGCCATSCCCQESKAPAKKTEKTEESKPEDDDN